MKFIVQKYNKTEYWYECHKVCKTYPEAEQEEQKLKKKGEKTYIDIRQNLRAADIKAAQSWFLPAPASGAWVVAGDGFGSAKFNLSKRSIEQ